jgi:hypothetical protein
MSVVAAVTAMLRITLVGTVVPVTGDPRVTPENNIRITPEGNRRIVNG